MYAVIMSAQDDPNTAGKCKKGYKVSRREAAKIMARKGYESQRVPEPKRSQCCVYVFYIMD